MNTMYYRDLTAYRDDGTDDAGMSNIYPSMLNVGWLDGSKPFTKGKMPGHLRDKLLQLTLSDQVNAERQRDGSFDPEKALVVHMMHVRGSPYRCPLCPPASNTIVLDPHGAERPTLASGMVLGLSEVCIPAAKPGRFYSFPSLLYHYVSVHDYLPPPEFLEALEHFRLDVPYDAGKAQHDLECHQVTTEQLRELDAR